MTARPGLLAVVACLAVACGVGSDPRVTILNVVLDDYHSEPPKEWTLGRRTYCVDDLPSGQSLRQTAEALGNRFGTESAAVVPLEACVATYGADAVRAGAEDGGRHLVRVEAEFEALTADFASVIVRGECGTVWLEHRFVVKKIDSLWRVVDRTLVGLS